MSKKSKLNVVTLCILEITKTKRKDKQTLNKTKTMDVTHEFALSLNSFHFRPPQKT